jgi:PUA domain protein|eukprot:scaffold2927_cov268-Chaetoceros_neogracile.AAC.42
MFKRFDPDNDISTSTSVKASVQRGIKNNLKESHPLILEEHLDILIPKKRPLIQYKVGPHLMLYCSTPHEGFELSGNEPIIFQSRDGPILPVLRFVHQYPTLGFNKVTVDQGAIPFILGGANIMCPGLTNPGGEMPEDGDDAPALEKGVGVVVYAEGKEHALAVGVMKMSSAQM